MWEPLFSPYSLGSVCYLPGPRRPKGTKLSGTLGFTDTGLGFQLGQRPGPPGLLLSP